MAGENFYQKIRGFIGTIFQFGLGGPQIKVNGSDLQIRDADDTAYANLAAASPVSDSHVATKRYVDKSIGIVTVSRQANCSVAIPNNTGTRGFVVVTTAGSGTVIGDLLFDDGSSSGQMEIIAKKNGQTISITQALTGGSISFDADSLYTWNDEGSAWLKIADIGNLTGPIRALRFVINNTASQDSSDQVPANNRVIATRLQVTTPYSGGAGISVGRGGTTPSTSLLMASGDNVPQSAKTYVVEDDIAWGTESAPVRVTVTGTPAAGAGVVWVLYSNPNG